MQGTCRAWRVCGCVSTGFGRLILRRSALALIEFAAEMYRPLVRCDQRAKGEQYVRGLLLEGRRKSIQPMAAGCRMVMRRGCSTSSPTRHGMTCRSGAGWRGG